MTSLATIADNAGGGFRPRPFAPVMTITEDGLVLCATVLAPLRRDAFGLPELKICGAELHILALLSTAYGRSIGSGVLDNIRRGAQYWQRGEPSLAAIELALSALPPLPDDEQASYRLFLSDKLLAEGLSPRELMKACGLAPAPLDLVKTGYNPNQPRIPVGSPDGGQWMSGDAASEGSSTPPQSHPSSATETVLSDYEVIKEPPKNAKVVMPPDGVPVRGGDPPTLLIAPPHADYHQVYAAGQAIASLSPFDQILHIRADLHQGGTYDFQRDPIRQETQPAYANASNYAVGVYLAGAGYPLGAARKMAEAYAFFNSNNYGNKNQTDWLDRGWHDGTAGRWK